MSDGEGVRLKGVRLTGVDGILHDSAAINQTKTDTTFHDQELLLQLQKNVFYLLQR